MANFWLLLHVLSAIIAFGAFFAAPMVARSADGANTGFAKVAMYIQAPALLVLLITGILNAYSLRLIPADVFKETWISIAFALWLIMAVVMFFLIRAQKAGAKSAQALTGVMHLLLIIALWAMIFQPGAPG
ncbi:hypothetical protein IMCC26207_10947 [Actinobacteria bacterium IMCC26207]|nr:hypothetical protein IMCC26207_10947 [Actinobacteria bacterium IMCC26207]